MALLSMPGIVPLHSGVPLALAVPVQRVVEEWYGF